MATSPLPVQRPEDIDPYGIYGYGYGPYGGQGGAQNAQFNFGQALGASGPVVDPNASMESVFAANRNLINTTGNQLGGQAGNQLNYYGGNQQLFQNQQNQALNSLSQTPGFNPEEAGKIGTDYSQFNTGDSGYDQARGTPYAAYQGLNKDLEGSGAMLNSYQSNLGGQLGQYSQNLGGATDEYGNNLRGTLYSGVAPNVRGAVGELGAGLDQSQGKFSGLDAAVNSPDLQFDPNNTEQQMSDQDVQDMRTAAGVSAGNQFRTAEDTLERQAAAAGNTSPAALAAMRQQLVTQNAATAGDVENQAEINAKQAQYGRAADIERQREGAAGQRTGFQAQASLAEQAAAQRAAELSGMAGLSSEQQLGQQALGVEDTASQAKINAANQMGGANINAANNYGQFSTNQANTMAGQRYTAGSAAEQASAARAAAENAQRYQQGTGSAGMTSQGAQTLGGARMTGEGAYRSGVAQQQGMAQQGGQAATQAQLGAYGTQTQGINSNTGSQASFAVGKPSLGDTLGQGLSGLLTGGGKEQGGIVTEPEITKLGEHGPEMVIPLGRYKSKRPEEERAA